MIKAATKSYIPAVLILVVLLACLALPTRAVLAAGPFTVNTTADTNDASLNGACADASGQCSLRAAIQEANFSASATTIIVPAGAYNLSLGALTVAPNGNRTIIIDGAGAATTTIRQIDGVNRVFEIDFAMLGGTVVTIDGVTITGGRDAYDRFGGAGILAGGGYQGTLDSLTLTNSIIADNHVSPPNVGFTGQPGGGVQMFVGNLTVTNCTFTNNTSASSQGGAIAYLSPQYGGTVSITGSTFSGNSMTNTATSGSTGGGAVYLNSSPAAPNTITINNSTFTTNSAVGGASTGTTYGGAIYINTGVLSIDHAVFSGNIASGNGGQGGAIYVDSGTLNLQYSRLVGNSAANGGSGVYNHSTNGAVTTAINNWWGCNAGPAAAGCDQAAADGAGLTVAPWIVLSHTANPNPIRVGETTTLTASFLRNSAGGTLTTAQASLLVGSPVSWSNAVLGSLSGQQATIQSSGTAAATFTAGFNGGTGQATATVDNGPATASFTIIPVADLAVVKTAPPAVTAGTNLAYTISVTNNGPSAASNVTLTDVLPAETAFISQAQTGGANAFVLSNTGNTVSNTIASLPVGASATFQITTRVSASRPAGSSVSNTASVTTTAEDQVGSNNSSTTLSAVTTLADLAVTKNGPAQVTLGGNSIYTVSLTNNGPSDAAGVTLTDALPAGTAFVSQNQTSGPSFVLLNTGNNIENTRASLPVGETAVFSITASVNSGLTGGSTLTNTATAVSTTSDSTPANNSGSVSAVVNNPPAFTSADSTTFTVGAAGTFNVTASGYPVPAFSETGTLPAGVTFVDNGNGTATLSGTPAAGSGGTYTLSLSASNRVGTNASQSFTLTVVTVADLAVVKTSPPTVTAGTNLTYTVSVTNNGPSPAENVILTDLLPAATTFISQAQTGGANAFILSNTGNSINNTIASLPAGATAAFQIVTRVFSFQPDASLLSNTAIAANTAIDPDTSNNISTALTTVTTAADLAVTKSGPAVVIPANNFTYTVSLTNNGPSDAVGVTLTDALPSGTTFSSQNQTGGPSFTLSTVGNVVQNSITVLAAGETAVFSITASVDSGQTGGSTLTNTAAGASATSDPTPANNSASATATINLPPLFTSADSKAFTIGVPGTFSVTASGYPAPSLSATGALPSGVTFVDNGNGTATLSGTPAAGSGGTYILSLSASNGVGSDASQTFTLTVYPLPEITSANAATFTVGMPGTFTVTATGVPTPSLSASGALPSGVTFVDNGDGTAALSGTPALGTVSAYPLTITAYNTSGIDYNQSFTLTVQKMDSAVTVASSSNPSVSGQSVTFTATVTSGAGTPTGSIQFSVDGLPTGAPTGLVNGSASLSTVSLTTGTHAVSAAYAGDANFNPSTSALSLSQVVNQASTSTSLSVTFGPSIFKLPVTASAVVAPVAPGAGLPSGTVTFMDGATLLGTVALDGSGTAVLDISSIPRGTHNFTATYNGSSNFTTSSQTDTVLIPYINFLILISK